MKNDRLFRSGIAWLIGSNWPQKMNQQIQKVAALCWNKFVVSCLVWVSNKLSKLLKAPRFRKGHFMGPQCFWSFFVFSPLSLSLLTEGREMVGPFLMDDKWLCTATKGFLLLISFLVRVYMYLNFFTLSRWWCLKLQYQSELFTVMHSVMFVIRWVSWFHEFLLVFQITISV